jgi:hypothetical protein
MWIPLIRAELSSSAWSVLSSRGQAPNMRLSQAGAGPSWFAWQKAPERCSLRGFRCLGFVRLLTVDLLDVDDRAKADGRVDAGAAVHEGRDTAGANDDQLQEVIASTA